MPNDEAMKRAAGELMLAATMKIERDALVSELTSDELQTLAGSAISAYFADVPVSEGMRTHGAHQKHMNDPSPEAIFKAMCRQHAKELNNGR